MQNYLAKGSSNHSHQIKVSTFLKITVLLCLTNFIIIGRLHMFDECATHAQELFNKKLKLVTAQQQSVYVPKLNNMGDLVRIFTDMNLEANYLLPLVFQASTLLVALASSYVDRIFISLIVCLVGNLLSFLAMLFYSQDMLAYRATYLVQGLLAYPFLIVSSFGVVKLCPKQLLRFKGYYASLMFLLPQLSIPYSYWFMHANSSEETNLLYSSTKLIMCGLFVNVIALIAILESRENIAYTLEQRFISAFETARLDPNSNQIKETQFDKNLVKRKLQMVVRPTDFALKQCSRVFEKKEDGISTKKPPAICIPRQKLGILLMAWGGAIAIGRQLPELRQKMLKDLIQTDSNPEIEMALQKSSAGSEIFVMLATLLATLVIVALIRRRKYEEFQIIVTCLIIGYSSLILLFVAANQMITPSLWLIGNCTTIGQIFFSAIIIPGIMLIEESGMRLSEGVSVLLVMSWAFELVLRIMLLSLEVQARIFGLAITAVGCCFLVQKIGKECMVGGDSSDYNKIKQEMELDIEMAVREEEESIEGKIEQQLKNSP